jgi:anti-anti-sigma factor
MASILLLDDHGTFRIWGSLDLETTTTLLTHIHTVEKGLFLLAKQSFSLVIIAHSFGSTNAFDFLETAKSIGFVKTRDNLVVPPFVLYLDSPDTAAVRKAWQAGFTQVITKTMTREQVLQVIHLLLQEVGETGGDVSPIEPPKEAQPGLTGLSDMTQGNCGIPEVSSTGVIRFKKIVLSQNHVIYYLSGSLSKGTGFNELHQSILEAVRNGVTTFFLDIQQVGYINSSGIGGLVSLCNEVDLAQSQLYVLNAQEAVFTVLARMDLLRSLRYRNLKS